MKLLFSALIFLSSLLLHAQGDSLQSIMLRGISYSESQAYDLSLIEYQKAFNIEPKNAFVNYEMALSHYYLGNKTRAEKYALTASKENSEHGIQAIVLLGAIYDDRGDHAKSIKIYQKGIKTFGDYYLLWYNLGVTANTAKNYELAEEAFLKSISNKRDHAGSHYALASIMMVQNRRVEAVYPLFFFLMLEPNTERSEMAFTDIKRLNERGVIIKTDDEGKRIIELQVRNSEANKSMLDKADLYLSTLEASKYKEENQGKSEFELFSQNSKLFFEYVEYLNSGQDQNFYCDYYIPFFAAIAKSPHHVAFTHFIRQQAYLDSFEWVKKNTIKLEAMFDWLDQQEYK